MKNKNEIRVFASYFYVKDYLKFAFLSQYYI